MGTKAVFGKGEGTMVTKRTDRVKRHTGMVRSSCFTHGQRSTERHTALRQPWSWTHLSVKPYAPARPETQRGKGYGCGSISRILFHADWATWWQPCLYSVCYHTPPATYPRTLVGPTSPEHHRISFTRRLATRKPIRPFGASSYLVLLRVMLTLPSMSPWMRWALTPPFHPYPGNPFTV